MKRRRKSIKEKCEKTIVSKSSKLQATKKLKDAFSSSNEVYLISESPLKRKTNKQIVLTSKFKKKTPKKTKYMLPAKRNKYKKFI